MGEIVAAFAAAHAPQLITRPPDEKPEQLDASIAALQELGAILDETKPDALIFLGSDHLETFSPLNCYPTFGIVAGTRAIAKFGGKTHNLPIKRDLAEHFLGELIDRGFDLAYSEDAELGHTFSTPFEHLIGKRDIPVVPFFTNVYLPPLPTPKRCRALGEAIADVMKGRPERVAILASGGMSHYPGTRKYPTPEFDFDYWMISELEAGRIDSLMNLTAAQLDEAGNTEMLTWMTMFGAIGPVPGELIRYTPTWHHGHGFMRFLPRRERKNPPLKVEKKYGGFQFKNAGFEFYVHPPASAYALNRLLFDVRTDGALRKRLVANLPEVADEYGLDATGRRGAQALIDVANATVVSDYAAPLVEAGAHPLQALMSLHVIFSTTHRAARGLPEQRTH
jgi:aromatic ring-opening dioxygenase catalytic subunit (LigB family)